ncbi:MAG: hypothetical protein ACOCUL_00375 [Bacteroidota bacterium]
MRKAVLLKSNHQYERAIKELERITSTGNIDPNDLAYEFAINNFLLHDYNNAYNNLIKITSNQKNHQEYFLLRLLTLNELGEWEQCKKEMLEKADPSMIYLIQQLPVTIDYKYPGKAFRLSSIVPGLGQLYAGYPLEAITSFSIHTALSYLIFYEFITGGFVFGTIYGFYPLVRFYQGGKKLSRPISRI